MRCAFQFPLFPTFPLSVPLLVVIWSYPEQGYYSAPGNFVWLVRPPGTVYHWTFVLHLHYQLSKTCSRHIFSHVLTSRTNCFTKYEQQTFYDVVVVTPATSLRLKNSRFIVIIITNLRCINVDSRNIKLQQLHRLVTYSYKIYI